jgi:hypothetical protein
MLCGDETNAVVADLGSSQCRFGTAGHDLPRYSFTSVSCICPELIELVYFFAIVSSTKE